MLLWFARSVSDRSHVVMISEVTLRQFLSARFLSLDCAVHTLQLHPNFWVSCGRSKSVPPRSVVGSVCHADAFIFCHCLCPLFLSRPLTLQRRRKLSPLVMTGGMRKTRQITLMVAFRLVVYRM
jgi:hypothetical protein